MLARVRFFGVVGRLLYLRHEQRVRAYGGDLLARPRDRCLRVIHAGILSTKAANRKNTHNGKPNENTHETSTHLAHKRFRILIPHRMMQRPWKYPTPSL